MKSFSWIIVVLLGLGLSIHAYSDEDPAPGIERCYQIAKSQKNLEKSPLELCITAFVNGPSFLSLLDRSREYKDMNDDNQILMEVKLDHMMEKLINNKEKSFREFRFRGGPSDLKRFSVTFEGTPLTKIDFQKESGTVKLFGRKFFYKKGQDIDLDSKE